MQLPRGSQVIPNHALGGQQQQVHVTVGVDDGGRLQAYVQRVAGAAVRA